MAVTLSTVFQFREDEFTELINRLSTHKVVAVIGHPGVGKTRISIEAAKRYVGEKKCRVLCIRSLHIPILEDLASYIEKPGNYLIFVDDANELADIKILLEYLNKGREGYDVRFIVTMRNYAADAVIKSIEEHTEPWVLRVKGFSDDEIKEFLKVNMQINNPRYVNHIIRIAEGNPRIAYMAGQLAKKEQSLDAIGDAVQLYENYYGKYLSDS